MLCPRCAGELVENCPTCPACGWVRPHRDPSGEPVTADWRDANDSQPINTSGTDLTPPMEVREMGFCWGGFALPFWFSMAHGIAWGCLGHCFPFSWWLGRDGHELAWRSRRFRSYQQFVEAMRVWNRWGKIAFAPKLAFLVGLLIVMGVSFSSFGGRPQPEGSDRACLRNFEQLARACQIYSYDYDDRLPPAGSWRTAVTPLLPDDKLPRCALGTHYAFNSNVSGQRLRGLERFVGLVYEADQSGRIAYVHRAGHLEANVACTDGEAFSECLQHPGRVDWAGPPPPGLAAETR